MLFESQPNTHTAISNESLLEEYKVKMKTEILQFLTDKYSLKINETNLNPKEDSKLEAKSVFSDEYEAEEEGKHEENGTIAAKKTLEYYVNIWKSFTK